MPFKDSQGIIGRPQRGPRHEKAFNADSPSKSLNHHSKTLKLERKLRCKIRQDNYLIINTSQIVNDQNIKVSKTMAIQFARWILSSYGVVNGTSKTNVARESKGYFGISSGEVED